MNQTLSDIKVIRGLKPQLKKIVKKTVKIFEFLYCWLLKVSHNFKESVYKKSYLWRKSWLCRNERWYSNIFWYQSMLMLITFHGEPTSKIILVNQPAWQEKQKEWNRKFKKRNIRLL